MKIYKCPMASERQRISFILGQAPNKFSSPKWSVLNIEAYKQVVVFVDFMCVCECKRIIMKEERS